MFQLGKLAIQSTVSTLGTTAIAAQAMTNILENLNGIGGIGVGIGLMTIVGQCLGANRKDEAVYYIKKLCVIAEIVMAASCVIVFALTKPITILGGMEPESAKMCLYMVGWITVVKPIVCARIYSGIWNAGCRGCEVFDDSLLHQYVGVPGDAVHLSLPRPWLRTDRGVDRHVYRLDDPGHRIHIPLYGPEMARA